MEGIGGMHEPWRGEEGEEGEEVKVKERDLLAPAAQTTVGDFGECSLAGGFTPRPGLVALRRARSKPSSSRHRPFAARDPFAVRELKGRTEVPDEAAAIDKRLREMIEFWCC